MMKEIESLRIEGKGVLSLYDMLHVLTIPKLLLFCYTIKRSKQI